MDDGSIELNFATPSGIGIRPSSVSKKGRWTDRVKAKQAVRREKNKIGKIVHHPSPQSKLQAQSQPQPAPRGVRQISETKTAVAAVPTISASTQTTTRASPSELSFPPEKRQESSISLARPTDFFHAGPSRLPSHSHTSTSTLPSLSKPSSSNTPKPTLPTQVISSLFTSNPSLPRPSASQRISQIGAPSNAPLASDTSSFAGLGLDPLLVRHLKMKMSIEKPTGIQKSSLPFLLSEPLDIEAKSRNNDTDDEESEYDYEMNGDVESGDEHAEEENEVTTFGSKGKKRNHQGPLRDVFIQSQTGSGKTLTYLLPIVQTLLPLSQLSYIDRSIGTLAIILAPTRELAQQISQVLESILTMSLSIPESESSTSEFQQLSRSDRSFTRWLVSGLLVGGSTRTHEKAKLRKGVPIIVSTPGRLLDHLQNTSSFKCAKTLFLVLDEADRLMDLGFEETIQGIIKALDGRRRNEINLEKEMNEEGGGAMRWPYWSRGRRTILCSATIDAKVERLSGTTLHNPIVFRSTESINHQTIEETKSSKSIGKDENQVTHRDAIASALKEASAIVLPFQSEDKFTPPSQLSQKYVVTPIKLRLVTLVALLRSLVAPSLKEVGTNDLEKQGVKVIVFFSSTDSVDFHWKLLGGVSMGDQVQGKGDRQMEEKDDEEGEEDEEKENVDDEQDEDGTTTSQSDPKTKNRKNKSTTEIVALQSILFSNTAIHRLHGSLPLRTRLASLKSFSTPSPNPSILLATSVASRGLDLPLVRAVVQYDLPTEGGANEYVHRVGRTARAGKGGEAWAFVAPSEIEWVGWVEGKMGAVKGDGDGDEKREGGKKKDGVKLGQVSVEAVLRNGFGGRGHEYEARATEVQLAFERWVLGQDQNANQARKAFASHVRAYSTHPLEERRFFHVKSIHLGHLAKSFALREAPGSLKSSSSSSTGKSDKAGSGGKRKRRDDGSDSESDDGAVGVDEEKGQGKKKLGKESTARNETERRMYEAVRKAGRLVKSGGMLGEFAGGNKKGNGGSGGGGAGPGGIGGSGKGKETGVAAGAGGEFHVMDTNELEKMLRGKL